MLYNCIAPTTPSESITGNILILLTIILSNASYALLVLKIYFENSVGIGEHPQHVDEVDKLISKVAQAEENLRVLSQYR